MSLAIIALGSNLASSAGPPDATLVAAVQKLALLGTITGRSSLYSTAPVGYADQPRFLNAVVGLKTALGPHDLLYALLEIERALGRDRSASVPNGPRTLDLDIILYGDLILYESDLVIPHPRFAERAFVLVPLQEIAPDLRDPRSGLTVSELWSGHLSNQSPAQKDDIDAIVQVESAFWRSVLGPSS